jgi:tRNA-specific 2-thiouridylase
VGPRCSLARSLLTLSEVNWLAHDLQTETCPDKTHGVLVRIRSSQVPIPATVTLKSGLREATVALSSPDYGIAPGQACVFYQGTRVLGGGWII